MSQCGEVSPSSSQTVSPQPHLLVRPHIGTSCSDTPHGLRQSLGLQVTCVPHLTVAGTSWAESPPSGGSAPYPVRNSGWYLRRPVCRPAFWTSSPHLEPCS